MRQLATVQKIAEVQPIEGADSIEKVRVNDWWCVAKKGEFIAGDLCVYFEIDSLLPIDPPTFKFLEKGTKTKKMVIDGVTYEGYRLKTVKLRGQISQGLALPHGQFVSTFDSRPLPTEVGTDVSELLNIVKYEAPIPAELVGKMKGNLPAFIPKTDEERVQNMGDVVLFHRHLDFYVTEKLDGSSTTFYKKDGVFGVCSRNIDLLETEGNTLWKIARELDLEEKLPDGFAIQGETVGSGLQGNPLKLSDQRFYAYNVLNLTEGRYLDFDEVRQFLMKMGVTPVPLVHETYTIPETIEELIKSADGKSLVNPEVRREGLVIRPKFEMVTRIRQNDNHRFSFKVISNDYLLKTEQ